MELEGFGKNLNLNVFSFMTMLTLSCTMNLNMEYLEPRPLAWTKGKRSIPERQVVGFRC